eukprot:gene10879-13929_t
MALRAEPLADCWVTGPAPGGAESTLLTFGTVPVEIMLPLRLVLGTAVLAATALPPMLLRCRAKSVDPVTARSLDWEEREERESERVYDARRTMPHGRLRRCAGGEWRREVVTCGWCGAVTRGGDAPAARTYGRRRGSAPGVSIGERGESGSASLCIAA